MHSYTGPKVGIVIPVFNRKELTLCCLEKLCADAPSSFRVIVVDSGSTDGTPQAVAEKFSRAVVLQTTPSHWWAAATNAGIRDAMQNGCQYVLTCNDDNQATSATLEKLVAVAEMHRNSIVAATVCDQNSIDTVLFAGRRRSRVTDRFFYMNHYQSYEKAGSGLREVDLLHGKCTLFPVSVFASVGLFDEKAFPHLFADDDLVLRAKQRGYRLLVDLDTVILNDQSTTGLNPYDRRLGAGEILELFLSRRSAFQINTRTRFLWRHRRSIATFVITWLADYLRLASVILLRWLVPETMYRKIEQCYLRLLSI